MNFPKLYKRTSTGSVHTWQINVDGNSYWTESGQIDGVITKSKPTIVKGKNIGKANETTAKEQAIKDAKSKHDKQLKLDYHENIDDIDTERFTEPMLAKSYKDRKDKVKWPLLLQCKYNGGRCVAKKSGLFTRKGERYLSVPHIEKSLKQFFEKHPNAILDGELFNESYRQELSKIMSIIRRNVHLEQHHFDESKEKIKFYVYDGYNFAENNQDTPYSERKIQIDAEINGIKYLEKVPTWTVNNEDEMNKLYLSFVEQGHEGCILRVPDSKYENKRSSNLLKHKPVEDAEFLILDVKEGTGNWSGCAKIITLQMDDGTVFDGTFKGNMEDARECLMNKKHFIGKKYTIQYYGFTSYGVPNYAQFQYRNSTEEKDK